METVASALFYGLVTLISQQIGPGNVVHLNSVTLAPQGTFFSQGACERGVDTKMDVIFNETRHMSDDGKVVHHQQGMCFDVVPESEATYTMIPELTASYAGLRFQVGDSRPIPHFSDKEHCESTLESLVGVIPVYGEAYLILSGKCVSRY